MSKLVLTPKKALILFLSIALVLIAQGVWWVILMARLFDEKVDLAIELGASEEFVQHLHDEEIARQMMIGSEGIFFLILVGLGAYLIYRSLAKNEELNFHQQNFLMAVTHELKTPLASMKIYLDTLKSDKIDQEKKLAIIPRIKDDVNRLEKQVENILEAGRFERSGYKLTPEEIDLSQMVENCLSRLTKLSLKKELVINKNKFENKIIYRGDPFALMRAIDALLENSLKYNDADNIILDIDLYGLKNNIYLKIKDNGIGLAKADLYRIFERFYRVGNELSRTNAGSGLGLYLCREIIKAHKGTIVAKSEGIGCGVEFNIILKVNKKYENNSAG